MKRSISHRGQRVVTRPAQAGGTPESQTPRQAPHRFAAKPSGAILRRVMLALAALLTLQSEVLADVVTLRTSARVESLQKITLTDIADLSGSYAETFADLAIELDALRRRGPSRGEVNIDDVRRVLSDAGVNWGRLSLQGDLCSIRERAPDSTCEEATGAASHTGPMRLDPEGPPTLRLRVAKYISHWTNLPLEYLRMTFSEHQGELLSLSEEEYRFELTPIMSPDSLRIPVVVRVWQNGVPLRQETVTVDVEKRIPVVVLRRDLDRDSVIRESDVEVRTIWLSQSGARPSAGLSEVVGRLASKRLHAGKILRAGDLVQPVLISRRDKVRVYCLAGNLVLSTDTARALEDGRLGEWIQLQREGSRRTFRAKVQGRGIALVEIPQPVVMGSEE